MKPSDGRGYYLVLLSIHGLIRGYDLELGRDADTGGQTKYVLELARALGEHPAVERVDLITRRIVDDAVSPGYAEPLEMLSERVRIVRMEAGPAAYIPKEQLWDSLDSFVDNTLVYLRGVPRLPNLIHSHYADAGYVGARVASLLGLPLVHTGHSLGRGKRKRMLAYGVKPDDIERIYNITRRIEAEELALGSASRVITSTSQEIDEQYAVYDYYQPEQMCVVPPGTDLDLFHPPSGAEWQGEVAAELQRFLRVPGKAMVLAISRPDKRKNIPALVTAYGQSAELQELANLVIVAGTREDIRDMDVNTQGVLNDILLEIDRYNLYGKVAFPKGIAGALIPELYRLAALSGGVFINPALTEPFGLTLIEAAASGLPIVATEDGGPRDIIDNCNNGYLVDPLDHEAMAECLCRVLQSPERWQCFATNGIAGVREHYSWQAHVEKYLAEVEPLLAASQPPLIFQARPRSRLFPNLAVFSDLDQTLIGNKVALKDFLREMEAQRKRISFGIATGRGLEDAIGQLKLHGIPPPDVLITCLGTEIYYGRDLDRDEVWETHIDYWWHPRQIREVLAELPGLSLQPKRYQSRFKISYYIDPHIAPDINEIRQRLLQHEQTINAFFSFGQYLDITPCRASKGLALRWCAERLRIPLEHVLAAGGSGADEDMVKGNTLGVVVANRHHEELSELTGEDDRIFFASQAHAAGLLEAMVHYHFFELPEAEVRA